ncbi:hypothetical protein ACFSQD_07265 [Flavihumibacter stibioxidans]|uniref:Uncharacterized protein n=1 Tax=Flavihumibacter stibioxidans TaxID=1834163 RepID=A0ABR7M519_9BACT|nr:hypothetical protein [Flavihumibacter stibioxidans]MBC6490110.1 hypothetical protein [Flavihumibacter stibioxidans]
MLSETLVGEDLLAMQNEKGNICISIVVPTHRLSPERRVDVQELEKAIQNAKQLLEYKYPDNDNKPLSEAMDDLYSTIDFTHNSEGIGLYISSHLKLAVKFPFPVEEKVMVGDDFEIRDLLYKVNLSHPYYVLRLTKNGVNLFEGSMDRLEEITDKNFPLKYEDEYIYNAPGQSGFFGGQSVVKSVERDKSTMEAIRFEDFFRHMDSALNDYLVGNTPFIVMGIEKELAWFTKVSRHNSLLAGKISGSYHHANLKELSELVWPLMQKHFNDETKRLLADFVEQYGRKLGLYGIEDVWQAAREGRAFKLLVEKDYRCPGFISLEDNKFHLRVPNRTHKILADAVDEIIGMVLEKNGEVHFTDNGELEEFRHIALITRF